MKYFVNSIVYKKEHNALYPWYLVVVKFHGSVRIPGHWNLSKCMCFYDATIVDKVFTDVEYCCAQISLSSINIYTVHYSSQHFCEHFIFLWENDNIDKKWCRNSMCSSTLIKPVGIFLILVKILLIMSFKFEIKLLDNDFWIKLHLCIAVMI